MTARLYPRQRLGPPGFSLVEVMITLGVMGILAVATAEVLSWQSKVSAHFKATKTRDQLISQLHTAARNPQSLCPTFGDLRNAVRPESLIMRACVVGGNKGLGIASCPGNRFGSDGSLLESKRVRTSLFSPASDLLAGPSGMDEQGVVSQPQPVYFTFDGQRTVATDKRAVFEVTANFSATCPDKEAGQCSVNVPRDAREDPAANITIYFFLRTIRTAPGASYQLEDFSNEDTAVSIPTWQLRAACRNILEPETKKLGCVDAAGNPDPKGYMYGIDQNLKISCGKFQTVCPLIGQQVVRFVPSLDNFGKHQFVAQCVCPLGTKCPGNPPACPPLSSPPSSARCVPDGCGPNEKLVGWLPRSGGGYQASCKPMPPRIQTTLIADHRTDSFSATPDCSFPGSDLAASWKGDAKHKFWTGRTMLSNHTRGGYRYEDCSWDAWCTEDHWYRPIGVGQDLGSPGSCVNNGAMGVNPIYECNWKGGGCSAPSDIWDRTAWLVTRDHNAASSSTNSGDPGYYTNVWADQVSKCAVCEVPAPILVQHHTTACPGGYGRLWQGWSFGGGFANWSVGGGQDMGSPGSCLREIPAKKPGGIGNQGAIPFLECIKGDGKCGYLGQPEKGSGSGDGAFDIGIFFQNPGTTNWNSTYAIRGEARVTRRLQRPDGGWCVKSDGTMWYDPENMDAVFQWLPADQWRGVTGLNAKDPKTGIQTCKGGTGQWLQLAIEDRIPSTLADAVFDGPDPKYTFNQCVVCFKIPARWP